MRHARLPVRKGMPIATQRVVCDTQPTLRSRLLLEAAAWHGRLSLCHHIIALSRAQGVVRRSMWTSAVQAAVEARRGGTMVRPLLELPASVPTTTWLRSTLAASWRWLARGATSRRCARSSPTRTRPPRGPRPCGCPCARLRGRTATTPAPRAWPSARRWRSRHGAARDGVRRAGDRRAAAAPRYCHAGLLDGLLQEATAPSGSGGGASASGPSTCASSGPCSCGPATVTAWRGSVS